MTRQGNKVAFLTGQSDAGRNALSSKQRDFLARSGVPALEILDRNFPYRPCDETERKVPLWKASLSNALQYLASRGSAFPSAHRSEVMEVFASCERVVLLAGSCGLELLVNLRLPEDFLARTHVFAFGPVARSTPRCATLWTVQGDRDYISKWWCRDPDHRIRGHHLDYLDSPEVMGLFQRFYQSIHD